MITFEMTHVLFQRPWLAAKVMWNLEFQEVTVDFFQVVGDIPRISLELGIKPQLCDLFDHTKEDLVHWINDKSMDVVKVMFNESVKYCEALIAFFSLLQVIIRTIFSLKTVFLIHFDFFIIEMSFFDIKYFFFDINHAFSAPECMSS